MPKTPKVTRRTLLKGSAAAARAALVAKAGLGSAQPTEAAATAMGPSTKVMPYALPTASNVETVSLLTVGEAAGKCYRLVGIPDGRGAFANDSETFTLLANHELVNTVGITHSHGSKGSFVSQWIVDRKTMRVPEGMDQAAGPQEVYLWDIAGKSTTLAQQPGTATARATCPRSARCRTAAVAPPTASTSTARIHPTAWARIVTGVYAGQVGSCLRWAAWPSRTSSPTLAAAA
jgi:hypothetical protein